MQRHLNLAWTADGVGDDAQARGAIVEAAWDRAVARRIAGAGQHGCSDRLDSHHSIRNKIRSLLSHATN